MLGVIFNNKVLAFNRREHPGSMTVPVDPFKTFGTAYGMFIPITANGYQFLRWINRGMKDVLPKKSIFAYFIHVSNDGEVMTVIADVDEDIIVMTPVTLDSFQYMHTNREVSEAMSLILERATTVSEAIDIVHQGTVDGIVNPYIFFVEDWVQHAKEKGYDKIFYRSTFS